MYVSIEGQGHFFFSNLFITFYTKIYITKSYTEYQHINYIQFFPHADNVNPST